MLPSDTGMRTGHISKVQCGRNKASCASDSQQWASEKNCSRIHSEVEQFGERQKELPETKHEIKGGKWSDHPKDSCWNADESDRGKGTSGGTGSGESTQGAPITAPYEEAVLNTKGAHPGDS